MQLTKHSHSKNYFEIGADAIFFPKPNIQYAFRSSTLGRPLFNPSATLPHLKLVQSSKLDNKSQQPRKENLMVHSSAVLAPIQTLKKKAENFESAFLKGKILVIDKIVYKKNNVPNRVNNSLSLSPIPKTFLVTKFKYDDSFAVGKLMKNHDITPFNKLIALGRESNTASFPYLTKVVKEIKKTEPSYAVKMCRKPRAYADCSCSFDKSISFFREKPTESDISAICPPLVAYYVKPHPTLFNENFILIVFEGAIGSLSQDLIKLRRGAIKFLKSIQNFFQLVVVTTNPDQAPSILQVLESKGIRISGFYTYELAKSKELIYLDCVIRDFSIGKPENKLLVIASLDLELGKEDLIFPKVSRMNQKLNIKLCPISNEPTPITFLVPHLNINPSSKIFETLLASLKSIIGIGNYSFMDWIKDCRGKFKVVRSSFPYEKIMQEMPFKRSALKCSLHKSYIRCPEELPINYFVIYLE